MKTKVCVVALILCCVTFLCACGNELKKYAGSYENPYGFTLTLSADGTYELTPPEGMYTTNDAIAQGSWKLEDDAIVIKGLYGTETSYASVEGKSVSTLRFVDCYGWDLEGKAYWFTKVK